jgi:dipeptidyl aminopeptidase/acylaminoacyl peptidase
MQNTLWLILGTILTAASHVWAEPSPTPRPKHVRESFNPNPDKPGTAVGAPGQAKTTPEGRPIHRGTSPNSSAKKGEPSSDETITASNECVGHPIETFVQIASSSSPQAGRKGVYFLSDMREVPQVFYQDTPGSWPKQISFFPDGVAFFRVSPDGQKLLLITHVGGDEQYDVHILENDAKLTPLLVDRTDRVESVQWSPDSKWFAYTSNQRNRVDFDLYRFDLSSQKATKLSDLTGLNTISDVSPDGKWIALTNYRSISDSDVLLWNIPQEKLVRRTSSEGTTYHEASRFTGDSKKLFVLSDAEKGVLQAFLFPLEIGERGKLLSSGNWPIEDIFLSDNRDKLVLGRNEEGYSRLEGYELDRQGNKKGLLALPLHPKSIIRSLAFFKSGEGLYFAETNSKRSADIWSWSQSKKTQWTKSTHGLIRSECFTEEKLIHYPSFDGKQIPAFLFLPRQGPSSVRGPIPFIVHVHGGPEAQYRPQFSRIFQYFLQRGFGILAPNVRGSTGYGRDYTDLDNYKKRMDSVKDVVEGAKWLLQNRYTMPGSLAIYGGSYGGFLVLRSIQVAPELFSAASESVGIANFVTFLQNTKPYRRALREVEYGPLSDTEFLKSVSPMEYLNDIKTPLLIFHGANDPRVPVSETEQIVEALKKQDVPVEYKIFMDEGHGNAKLRNIMEQARLMAHFFEKNLTGEKKKSP